MLIRTLFTTALFLSSFYPNVIAQESLQFPSLDGLTLSADLYLTNNDKNTPFIVLFHQAGSSRGEYLDIAPKLNALGFNALAVDQRSGGSSNRVSNQSAKEASAAGKGTSYTDALQDLEAALLFVKANYAEGRVIAWGSSYSAALSLKLAGDKPELASAVLAFSPGEYFQPRDWIQSSAANIQVPTFISSAKGEQRDWQAMFDVIKSEKSFYLPETNGRHGSSALWESQSDSDGYWEAVEAFLEAFKN